MAENFARDFGLTNPALVHTLAGLTVKLAELTDDAQVNVYRSAWSDSLQISYGSIETDDVLLAKHTYLAVLARLLVWAAFERRALENTELPDVLTGLYFGIAAGACPFPRPEPTWRLGRPFAPNAAAPALLKDVTRNDAGASSP